MNITRFEGEPVVEGEDSWESTLPPQASAGKTPPTSRLLRWIELQGLAWERGALRRGRATDAWWMGVEEEVTGPHSFREILTALVDGRGPVAVVHESEAQEDEPPWMQFDYRPIWQRPLVARCWERG